MKHIGPISGVAANDKYIATAGYDSRLIIWDRESDLPLKVFYHDHLVNQCEFSPCGNYLVSSSSDYSARIWSLNDMRLLNVIAGAEDDIEHSAFSPDAQYVALASLSGKIHVHQLKTGRSFSFLAHQPYVKSLTWSHDGRYIVSCGEDGVVKKWNINKTSDPEILISNETHTDTVITLDDLHYLAGNDKGELVVISDKCTIYQGHDSGVKRLSLHRDSGRVISVGYDNNAIIWQFVSGQLIQERSFKIPSQIWTRSCAFTDSDTVIFGTFGSTYAKYSINQKIWDLSRVKDVISINSIFANGDDLYTVGDSGVIQKNGYTIGKVPSLCNFILKTQGGLYAGGHTGEIFDILENSVAYKNKSPFNTACEIETSDGSLILAGDYGGNILVFKESDHGLELIKKVNVFDNAIKSIRSNGSIAVAVCATGDIAELDYKKELRCETHKGVLSQVVNDVCFINDESYCLVGRDKKLVIRDSNTFTILSTPHANSIKSVASCGRYICTGGYTGTVCFYDLERREWCATKQITNYGISSIDYIKEDQQFCLASYDGNVYKERAIS